jgi:tRNA(Ile)-lysidine synthetase-like protein
MELRITPGTYVVAVSGGVDSMVLLDLIRQLPDLRLIVAHYDHGIRTDSHDDRLLVEHVARTHDLLFVFEEGNLGRNASEAVARAARYNFLERVRRQHHANAIVTAHHADDVLETAVINILRGTGRKGLTALANTPYRLRPLLDVSKADVVKYATGHSLEWHEDSTNSNERYLRNYVRRQLLPRFSAENRAELLRIIAATRDINTEVDQLLSGLIPSQGQDMDRRWFIRLPHAVAKEVLASWLRAQGVTAFDARTLERVVVAAKTLRHGATIDIRSGFMLEVSTGSLALLLQER